MMNISADSATFAAYTVDAQNPWLGLHPFTEELQQYFYGRDSEADDLFRRVNRKTLTVLFGQSGLGKTSLVRAGLFPRLRKAGFLPVAVRIVHTEEAPSPAAQIIAAFLAAVKESGANLKAPQSTPESSLWEYFHHVDFSLEGDDGKRRVPVLVFDQFEEVFTLGRETETLRRRSAELLTELADLVENRPSARLLAQFEADPDSVENFQFDRAAYRALISLREDYLANLEDMRQRMPSLSENRMRLTRMNGEQALDAVTKPGGHLVSPSVSRQIVRFVAGASLKDEDHAEVDLTQYVVDPAMLSLFCAELNNRRRAQKPVPPQITADLLAGSRDTILRDYYERCLADAHPEVRRFVEDELLTELGYRVDVPLEKAQKTLVQRGADEDALDALVKRRLLRIEDRLHVRRVELTHDVLTSIVRQSRDERQQQEQAQRALAREHEIRDKLRVARKRQMVIVSVMTAFLAVVSLFGVFSYAQWQKALAAEEEARTQRDLAAAETERAELNENLAKERAILAEAETKRAETNAALAKTNELLAKDRALAAEKLQATARDYIEQSHSDLNAMVSEFSSLRGRYLEFLERSIAKVDEILEVNPNAVWATHNKTYSLASAGDIAEKLGKRELALKYSHDAIKLAQNLPEDPNTKRVTTLASGIAASTLRRLEDYQAADKALQYALTVVDQLKPLENEDASRWKAYLHQAQGESFAAQSQWQKCADAYQAAADLHSRWLKNRPDDDRLREDMVTFNIEIADALIAMNKPSPAIEKLNAAKDLRFALWREEDSIKSREKVSSLYEKLAAAHRAAGDVQQARTWFETQVSFRKQLTPRIVAMFPDSSSYDPEENDRSVCTALQLYGSMEYSIGNPEIGWEKHDEALTLARQLRDRVRDQSNLANLSWVLVAWGNELLAIKQFSEAEPKFKEALQLREEALDQRPDDSVAKGEVAYILQRLSTCLFEQERWSEAAGIGERRLQLRREAYEVVNTPTNRGKLCDALGSFAYGSLFLKQPEKALEAAEEALKIDPSALWIRTNMAHALLFLGKFDQAAAIYRKFGNEKLGNVTFGDECRADFQRFRKAGIEHPRMVEIEALLPPPTQQAESKPEAKEGDSQGRAVSKAGESAKEDQANTTPSVSVRTYATTSYERDTRNRIIRRIFLAESGEPMLNDEGIAGWATAYNNAGNEVERWFFDASLRPKNIDDGYGGWIARYSPTGKLLEKSYFHHNGNPAPWDDGYNRVLYEYDEADREKTRSYCYDVPSSDRNHRIERWTFDEKGHKAAIAYLGSAGEPVLAKLGMASIRLFNDEKGRPTRREFFDLDGKLTLSTENIAGWNSRYDENGHEIERRFFDLEDKPTPLDDGYAGWTARYDTNGKMIEKAYFGTDDKPAQVEDGYTRVGYEYDADGKERKRTYHYDLKPHEYGHRIEVWTYDSRAHVESIEYLDASGGPTLIPSRYASLRYERDSRGNITRRSFFGVDGKPVLSNEGVAGWTSQYDHLDNETERRFFDTEGKPKVIDGGSYAGWTGEYNENKTKVSGTFFDAAGKPAAGPDGNSKFRHHFGNTGRLVQTVFEYEDDPDPEKYRKELWNYNDEQLVAEIITLNAAGNPTRAEDGHFRVTIAYDDSGKLTKKRFDFQLDNDDASADSLNGSDDSANKYPFAYAEERYAPGDKLVGMSYHRSDGSLVKGQEGYARRVVDYDEAGTSRRGAYFDERGRELKVEVRIDSVMPGSQGEKLKLQANDVLVSYDGQPVTDMASFIYRRSQEKLGETSKPLTIRRGNDELTIDINVGMIGATLSDQVRGAADRRE